MSERDRHFYEFAGFRLDAQNPSLWRGGELVSIPPKALETLILLVEKKGEIVSRDELLEEVWKNTFVEEGNINYTVSQLRKTLENKNLIQTVPRRGYRFNAAVREISQNGKKILPASAADADAGILPDSSAPVLRKSPARRVFTAAAGFFVLLLLLAGFAFWWRADKPAAKPAAVVNQPIETSEAMQAYTRGKMILEKKGSDNRDEKAIDEFQRAVTLDPTLALAYAGLGEGFLRLAVKLPSPQSLENYAKARVAAEKALALDSNSAEAYSVRGWVKRNADWDWQGAEADLRRAIELDPNNATTHYRLSLLLSGVGRNDEALAAIKTAYRLDPISDLVLGGRFPILESRGDYDEALKLAEDFVRESKENPNAVRAYGTFLYHRGDYARVIELGEKSFEKNPDRKPFAWLSLAAGAYQKTGQTERAAQLLRELEIQGQNDTKALYSLAMNYAELGRADDALWVLRKCFEMREERIMWIKNEPRFESLHPDSRFREIVGKMGLN